MLKRLWNPLTTPAGQKRSRIPALNVERHPHLFLFVLAKERHPWSGGQVLEFRFIFRVPKSGVHSYYYALVLGFLSQLQCSVPVRHIFRGDESCDFIGVGSTSVMCFMV